MSLDSGSKTNGYLQRYFEEKLSDLDDLVAKNKVSEAMAVCRDLHKAMVETFLLHKDYHARNETTWGLGTWIKYNPFKALACVALLNLWFISDFRAPIINAIVKYFTGM